MTDIIHVQGTREQKIEAAKRIRAELEEQLPEMAELRRQLVAAGMAADNLSSVARVVTENIDYRKTRDDPEYYRRQFAKPPIVNEDILHAIQARTSQPSGPAHLVRNSRGGPRRR